MELSELRVGDVIWNTDTGHTGRVSSIAGTKMVLLDPAGVETPFYFVPGIWEKLHDQAAAEFIALLQK
ncbi:MAG: hypothetical protein COV48_10515 [Elusimicrobia bacterium CG11_big_fil_rev_8_21_14_0_20_64_6]|nr:MAG: hypothetical protein COV48_10515 [Elusimicrobia bacterium CG11_big_fil_rev_8_21_14_0_20_64_6]